MRKTFIMLGLLAAVTLSIAAQNAIVGQVSGKVEYRVGTADWAAVTRGMQLPIRATISTGFGSTAVLNVAGSTIQVAQLTRLTIEQLADSGNTVSTGVFVPVGRVRASVAQTPGRSTDFQVRTAQSTAAVRGTDFETNGWQLTVSEGIVEFASLLGEGRMVSSTQISVITDGAPTDPLDELNRRADVGDGTGDFASAPRGSGYITVRWGE